MTYFLYSPPPRVTPLRSLQSQPGPHRSWRPHSALSIVSRSLRSPGPASYLPPISHSLPLRVSLPVSVSVCLSLCVCLCSLCTYLFMYVQVHICVHMGEGQRPPLGVIPLMLSTLSLLHFCFETESHVTQAALTLTLWLRMT